MRIEIWSDVVCPWCYIGKRRLETALSTFEHADDVEIIWRSYQLDPTAPRDQSLTTLEALGAKFPGGPDQVREMLARTRGVAAEEGLEFGDHSFHANTVDAHRVLHLALVEGGPTLQGALKEALLAAHFVDNANVGDHAVLTEVAVRTGLDAARVTAVLAGDEFADAVRADIDQARALGATGVPFFVLDRKYGVSGAQPAESFTQVLEQAWADAHPQITMVGQTPDGQTQDGQTRDGQTQGDETGDVACGPDGCAI
ncbi:DsbA family oxidoreductase [Nocardioides gilvus]|uniref:DsbA family oxidoreductase n=1 Tax=Nocardioides gilvus TaxID=1735589 RepID=UPI000D74ABC6|nr:DsbA family oxidoreductase [Nocardioides gilvus]